MNPSGNCIDLIVRFEGCKLKAYRCPSGVWTIGYGHTHGVTEGMEITKTQALAYLKTDVLSAANIVNALVRVGINQNEFDALTSFVYNVGSYHFSESTLLKKLNQGLNRHAVAAEFGRWVYSNKQLLQGLVKRREAETELFLRGKNGH